MRPEDVQAFQDAILAVHDCESKYVGYTHVCEVFRGQTAWEGIVLTFDLIGHPKAKRAYAWVYSADRKENYVTVLEIPPVDSPQSAVKVAIAAASKKPPKTGQKPQKTT